MKIALFASGNGSNVEAIIKGLKYDFIVICDNKDAYVIKRCEKLKVKCLVFNYKDFINKEKYELEILKTLKEYDVNLIVMAGYMRIITSIIYNEYKNKILNIHPSLLPSFKGKNAIVDAYNYKVKVYGITIHLIDLFIDEGIILFQKTIKYKDSDTLDDIKRKINKLELKSYKKVIKRFIGGYYECIN